MSVNTEVILVDTQPGLADAVHAVFEHFGGGAKMLRASKDVYLKVNAVGDKPFSYTDPEVLRAVIHYFRGCGARDIYVIENCTQANFTRLVFEGIGFNAICRDTGAIPVYLDETPAVPVFLKGIEQFVDLSRFVHDRLVVHRAENLYVSLPKLKTHSMSQVTLSIKNQFGLVHQKSRIADHNYRIHQKFADIYEVIRPDFALVDGLVATTHGHYFPTANADKQVVQMDVLAGGPDPLAVDVVCAKLIGFGLADVAHLALSAAKGLGEGDFDKITIVNRQLFDERKKQLSCELLEDFPPDLTIIRGTELCCKEGCRLNTESVVEMLYRDHQGRGGFTIVMGKGFDPAELAAVDGPVHIAGGCAIEECGVKLNERLGKNHKVTESPGCNDLALTVKGLCTQMKVNPITLARADLVRSAGAFILAQFHRTRANIVPLV